MATETVAMRTAVMECAHQKVKHSATATELQD